jgi:hypothetical protein
LIEAYGKYTLPGRENFAQIDKLGIGQLVRDLTDWLLEPIFSFLKTLNAHHQLNMCEMHLTKNILSLFDCMLMDLLAEMEHTEILVNLVLAWTESSILVAVAWGVGGILDAAGKARLSQFMLWMQREQVAREPDMEAGFASHVVEGAATRKIKIPMPDEMGEDAGSVFDFYFHHEDRRWVRWTEHTKNFRLKDEDTLETAVVPTLDSERNESMLSLLLRRNVHAIAMGEIGSGKSMSIQRTMRRLDKTRFDRSVHHVSRNTDHVQVTPIPPQ